MGVDFHDKLGMRHFSQVFLSRNTIILIIAITSKEFKNYRSEVFDEKYSIYAKMFVELFKLCVPLLYLHCAYSLN